MTLDIVHSRYRTRYRALEAGLLEMHRIHHYEKPHIETDVFGNYWGVAIACLQGQVSLARDGKLWPLHGNVVVTIPPYGIVEWHIESCDLEWRGYWFRPSESFKVSSFEARLFQHKFASFPQSLKDLVPLLETQVYSQIVSKEEQASITAYKIKDFLDRSYHSEILLSDIADSLNLSLEGMGRIFKRCFGITPVEYRTKLRVFESQWILLAEQQNVTYAGQEVGFNDSIQFNRQFKKLTGIAPSNFRKRRT